MIAAREAAAWVALAATLTYRLGWLNGTKRFAAMMQGRPPGLAGRFRVWRDRQRAHADAQIVTPQEFADIVAKQSAANAAPHPTEPPHAGDAGDAGYR